MTAAKDAHRLVTDYDIGFERRIPPVAGSRSLWATALAAGAALGVSLGTPGTAGAAVTCAKTGTTLEVVAGSSSDTPWIRRSGSAISVSPGAGADVACSGGSTTVTNIDTVHVTAPVGDINNVVEVLLTGGPFEPGATAEPSGTSEIEFDIELGAGFFDKVVVEGGPAGGNFRFGALAGGLAGANLNAPEVGGADGDDLLLDGVNNLNVLTVGGVLLVNLSGTAEFIGPLPMVSAIEGQDGDDVVVGGLSTRFVGNGGDDLLVSGTGDDLFNGDPLGMNAGTDTASYALAPGGVTIDLGTSTQVSGPAGQDTFEQLDIENLIGSPHADVLTGTSGVNEITGGAGTDVINGLAGADTLGADDGAGGDSVDCGGGIDTVTVDAVSGALIDTVTGCENVVKVDSDQVDPDTAITKHPRNRTVRRRARYRFGSNEPGSGFECALDRGPFKPCSSPHRTKRLKPGRHSFQVRAIDPASNVDPTPASDRFRVVRR